MKKTICLILTVLTAFCFLTAASAAGYTLPEKMERQLQVGSGLKGSFVIHSNADQELSPFVHSIRNAAYEIRGIRSGDDLHYYIYQPGEGETLSSLTEFCRIGNTGYLRSDFLPEAAYRLPDFEEFIASFLKAEGENPSILPELIRLLVKGPDPEEEEGGLDTASLEKQIELWISAFTAETTVESSENASPRLTQVFRIPTEALFNTVNVLVKTVSETPDTMEALKNVLSEDQIRTYLNPNLGYFYLEAMESLQLDGEIVFSRTMSTLGDLIQNTLTLPLDESKTGYSSIIFQNDEKRKTLSVSGAKGLFLLGLPVDFDFSAESYEEAVLQFIRIDSENREHRNIALRIELSKKHDKYEEEEETRNHETDRYTIEAVRDTSALPEGYSEALIPEMDPIGAELELHYSSKLQLSSPTTLEISCSVRQGKYDFTLAGQVKTASPWTFTPFDITHAAEAGRYQLKDFESLKEAWIRQAEEKLVRTPEEIRPAEPTAVPEIEVVTEETGQETGDPSAEENSGTP